MPPQGATAEEIVPNRNDGCKTSARKTRYHRDEMTLRLTEAELVRDIHAVLARVREEGLELIVEQDHRPVAVIKTPEGPGRKLSDRIASRLRSASGRRFRCGR